MSPGIFVCLGPVLLYSSSRTQRVVALSTGEAEVYASSSAACDAVLLARILHFITVFRWWYIICRTARQLVAYWGARVLAVSDTWVAAFQHFWLQNLVKDHHVISKHLKLMLAFQSWLMMLQQYQVWKTLQIWARSVLARNVLAHALLQSRNIGLVTFIPIDVPTSENMASLIKAVKGSKKFQTCRFGIDNCTNCSFVNR